MKNLRLVLILPALLLLALSLGCDNENGGSAMAQPAPMSGTDVTGRVNAPSPQTCPKEILIDGLEANDVVMIEITSTGDMMGEATITNTTKTTSASCMGGTDESLPPAEVKGCKVSSSTIPGLKIGDEIIIGVFFSSQLKQVTLDAPGSDSLRCAFITIETVNAM